MSRKQPSPLNHRSAKCVQPRPLIRRDQDTQAPKRLFVVEHSLSDPSSEVDLSISDELAALRAFFDLLSKWDESLKGEIEHT